MGFQQATLIHSLISHGGSSGKPKMQKKFSHVGAELNLEVIPELRGGVLVGQICFQCGAISILRWSQDDLICLWPFYGMLFEVQALSLRSRSYERDMPDDSAINDADYDWLPMTSAESLDGADYSVAGFREHIVISWRKWDNWGDEDTFPAQGRVCFSRKEYSTIIEDFANRLHEWQSAVDQEE